MKKTFLSVAVLLLCICMLATSCKTVKPGDANIPLPGSGSNNVHTTEPSTERVPSDPNAIIGKWYAAPQTTYFEFFGDHTMKLYVIAPGYFSYKEVKDGTYSYDGLTLQYNLDDHTTFNAPCKVENGTMTLEPYMKKTVFLASEELPAKHPDYNFPAFSELISKLPETDILFTGNTVQTELRAKALDEVKTAYWNKVGDINIPHLSEGTVKEGDRVNIDYEGYLDGQQFSGGSAKNQSVIAADGKGMIDGFGTALIGHQVGEKFDANVTFPKNYHVKEMAGKAVVFKMTVNYLYDMTVTDEMAKKEGHESLSAWVDEVYKKLVRNDMFELLPGLKSIELPEESYLFFLQNMKDYYHAYAFYYYNGEYDKLLEAMKMTEDKMIEDAKEVALPYFLAAEVARKYKLTPTEETIQKITDSMIKELTSNGTGEEDAKKYLAEEGKTELDGNILLETALDYLYENNQFVEKTVVS